MSPVHIKTRETKAGRRYVVYYRRGGRGFKTEYAGSFTAQKEARLRRDLIAGELAAGRDPRAVLAELRNPPQPRTLETVFARFIASRVDVGAKTLSLYRNARDRLGSLAELRPEDVTVARMQAWVAENHDLSPKTLAHYRSSVAQVLDFADVQPNPARSPKVRLPREDVEEIRPPSTVEWNLIHANVRERSFLPLELIECCGLRVSETVGLTYGDVDFAGSRLRVSRARTKRRTAGQRWLAVPELLLDDLAELCPLEDRHRDRRVFDLTDVRIRGDLYRACRDAGIAAYSPHDLRHRRISLWLRHGVDSVTVKTWAGHSKASMSLDVYGHVIVSGDDRWKAFWLDVYRRERIPGEALVRHGALESGLEADG